VRPFQILAVSMFFQIGRNLGGAIARSTGAVFRLSTAHTIYAALVVGGSIALVRSYGINGVAWAVTFALAAHFALMVRLTKRLIEVPTFTLLRSLFPGLCLAVGVGLSTWAAT